MSNWIGQERTRGPARPASTTEPGRSARRRCVGVVAVVAAQFVGSVGFLLGTPAVAGAEVLPDVPATVYEPPLVVNGSDSYGAGNGTRNYFETECFTSPENFAQIVTRQIGGRFGHDASCGGATSKELRDGSSKIAGINNDAWIAEHGADVDIVFTSMGGNDADFTTIVIECLVSNGVRRTSTEFGIGTGPSYCQLALDAAQAKLDSRVIIDSVSATLDSIRSKMPNATVVLVGYPNLKEGYQSVRDLLDQYTGQQRAEIDRRAAAEPGKWVFVDRRELFAGHEVGAADEWLWDVPSALGNDLELPDDIYHPKPVGWQMTAGLIATLPEVSSLGLAEQAKGGIVREVGSTASWIVTDDGVRHPILDGGSFECAYASNGQRMLVADRTAIEAALPVVGDPAAPVCEQPEIGDVLVDVADRAWYLDKVQIGLASYEVVLKPIATTAAFRCLVNFRGATVRRDVLATTLDRWDHWDNVGEYCLDPAEVDGKVVVDPDTNVAYLLERDGDDVQRRKIVDTESFKCLERKHGVADRSYSHLDLTSVGSNVEEGVDAPRCLPWQDYIGKVIEDDDHRQVLVTPAGQRGVRDGGTSRCLTAWEGRDLVRFDNALVNSIPADPAGWASCSPPVSPGQILRVTSNNRSYTVNRAPDGALFLRHIAESETYRCLVSQGATVVDDRTVAQVEAFVLAAEKQPVCVNAATFAGTIISTPSGRAELIDGQGVGHVIESGGGYLCLTLWAGVPVHTELFNSEQMAAIADGAPATCDAHMVAKNRIVQEPGGHAVYVDGSGFAHNIPSGHAFNCLVEAGVTVLPVPSHAWQQAFAYGADQPGCEKVITTTTGASYYQDAAGVVHWLRNTQSYYCAVDNGLRVQTGVAQATVNALPQGAWYPDCLSARRYLNTMIRRSDGTVWVVDSLGRRRHVPDGYSFECYKERGYRLVESNLTYDQANSLPEVGRMGFCLAKWQANGTIIRECGGTAYYVENSARRWIPSGWTYEAIQEWGRPVLNTCLNWEHIGSLPEVGRMPYLLPKWRFRNSLVHHSSGAVFKTDGNACRYHVRDWWTVERIQEIGHGFTGWNVNDEEINSLPFCGSHSFMLAKWRAENRVVRGPDGTSWFVRGTEWFWIPNGAIWNHLVRKYGLLGTFSWQHIDSIKWDRGRWAGYW